MLIALFMLVVDFSVMRVLLYKRAWLKKKNLFVPEKIYQKWSKYMLTRHFTLDARTW